MKKEMTLLEKIRDKLAMTFVIAFLLAPLLIAVFWPDRGHRNYEEWDECGTIWRC